MQRLTLSSFTEDDRFLIGITLGDGTIFRRERWDRVCSIRMVHCPEQHDWLQYKIKIANPILGSSAQARPFKNKGLFKGYQWDAGFSNFLYIYEALYENRKKVFRESVLRDLTARELALFWCDDGGIVKNLRWKTDPRTGKPYPNPLQETQGNLAVYEDLGTTSLIAEWIEDLTDSKPRIAKHKKTGLYYLRFNKKSLVNLVDSIHPFVPKCMNVKLDLTPIPVSERAQVLQQRAIRRHERAATLTG